MAKKGKLTGEFEAVDEIVRPERVRKYKYLFLIVCEDEKTEKAYFESFKSRIPKETIFLKSVGTGRDPFGVVERAILEKNHLQESCRREVDTVWVVFDKDDADLNAARITRFKQAFELAEKENIKLAYSNEAFELWLLLHLTVVDPTVALPRTQIYDLLQVEVRKHHGYENFIYIHGDDAILAVVADIGYEIAAFERAETLIVAQVGKEPLLCNPVTYVGELLKDLYALIAYFGFEG